MRRLTIITPTLLLLGSSVWAAAPVAHLARVTAELWPDYDRPAMLVMLDCEVLPGTTFPAVVEVRIPAAAGKPHAVAKRGPEGKLYMAKYTRTVQGAWATISVTTDHPAVRVEYYGALKTAQSVRSYHFEWPAAPKIDVVQLSTQVPLAAKDLKTVPPAQKLWRDPRQLVYQRQVRKGHVAGQPLQLDISYTNATGELSAALLRGRSVPPPMPKMTPPANIRQTSTKPTEKPKDDGFQKWLLYGLLVAAGVFVGVMVRGGKGKQG